MLALDRAGAETVCLAPNVVQMHVVNHLTGQVSAGESRNVLVEAARIARGDVRDIAGTDPAALDALILPGGFGVAKNLCNFAVAGADCEVNPDVAALVRAVHGAGKPVGAICIAPVLVARLLGGEAPNVTIGTDTSTASAIQAMGACHVDCDVGGTVVDRERMLVTTPAYMLAKSIGEAATGIEKLVSEVVTLARSARAAQA
jgi:enhancing lycopene biosynthesis protein 2